MYSQVLNNILWLRIVMTMNNGKIWTVVILSGKMDKIISSYPYHCFEPGRLMRLSSITRATLMAAILTAMPKQYFYPGSNREWINPNGYICTTFMQIKCVSYLCSIHYNVLWNILSHMKYLVPWFFPLTFWHLYEIMANICSTPCSTTCHFKKSSVGQLG
jgi:hypothetical protein